MILESKDKYFFFKFAHLYIEADMSQMLLCLAGTSANNLFFFLIEHVTHTY